MSGRNAAFLPRDALDAIGFATLGEDVLVHETAVIVNPAAISLGSKVRIDPFVTLSPGSNLLIGDHVHVATNATLLGAAPITLADYVNVSLGCRVLSVSDNFSGAGLAGPMVPEAYRCTTEAPVTLCRHALIGANCVILPGADIGEGTAVGALSLVNVPLPEWGLYAGTPARRIGERNRRAVLDAEARHRASLARSLR